MTERSITLELPASSAYVVLARTATSAVCARLGYPIDKLDDVALAVSEGVALLMQDAAPGSKVHVSLTPWRKRELIGLDADISVTSASGRPPRPTSFTWTVLASLVSNVSTDMIDNMVTLRLRSRQEAVSV